MRAVVQRVASASVSVNGRVAAAIDRGFLVLLGVRQDDGAEDAQYIATKIAGLRVFEDEGGKMNLALGEVGGAVLLVSQFTLYGDARKGRRPSFDKAARPAEGEALYSHVASLLEQGGLPVARGVFGALMQVALVNDGPVTILLDSGRAF
ncbi:MAG: D-tyrosyl-tRNA(Tyr) deacylase [Vicinamibacteraceae bacterium]|nr:D-tyrosyl-tRNA(Tyr) deacylase [Vicinamibacteraceae bacterium]